MWLSGKEFACNAEDAGDTEGSIPGSGRSPGGGPGNLLQYSYLGESHEQGRLDPCLWDSPGQEYRSR